MQREYLYVTNNYILSHGMLLVNKS